MIAIGTANLDCTSFLGETLVTLNVQLRPGVAISRINAIAATAKASRVPGLHTVQVSSADADRIIAELSARPDIKFAHRQQILHIQLTPNDPSFLDGTQWALNGTWGINAPAAWDVTTGSYNVIVAVVDTGGSYNNPDLINNIWINQAEIPNTVKPNLTDVDGNGIITFSDLNNVINQGSGKIVDTNSDGVITGTDLIASTSVGGWASGSTQDGNTGYPDDLIGWNWVSNNNNPLDDNGHGTVCAGEIGAVGNNGIGVAGVNWTVQLMILKTFNAGGGGSDLANSEAIHYAVDNGAKIINCSWGEAGTSSTVTSAIEYAGSHNVIVVAAAGNNSSNNDFAPFTPSNLAATEPNVIAVAAINITGGLAVYSDYGIATVQLAAPGTNVYSTGPTNGYTYDTGTSMAAPMVCGVLALVMATHPTWSYRQVMDAVIDHTTPNPALFAFVATGGTLNAAAAVSNPYGAYVVSSVPNGQGDSLNHLSAIVVTFNEEIDTTTFTTAHVSLSGPSGSITLTLTAVSGSYNHKFNISFASQTAGGVYTLTIGPGVLDLYGNQMDQDLNGVNGQSSDAYVATIGSVTMSGNYAAFVKQDLTTLGNWIGVYGSLGYEIIDDATSLPGYLTLTPSGETLFVFSASTTSYSALRNANGVGRLFATWYGGPMSIAVNVSAGEAYALSLYAEDNGNGRVEQIQVTDASTGAVFDTRTISSFGSGVYLQWAIHGNVIITINVLSGANALISGFFLDPLTITSNYLPTMITPSGQTSGVVGTPVTYTVTIDQPAPYWTVLCPITSSVVGDTVTSPAVIAEGETTGTFSVTASTTGARTITLGTTAPFLMLVDSPLTLTASDSSPTSLICGSVLTANVNLVHEAAITLIGNSVLRGATPRLGVATLTSTSILSTHVNVVHQSKLTLVSTSALITNVNVVHKAKIALANTSSLSTHLNLIHGAALTLIGNSVLTAQTHLMHKANIALVSTSALAAPVNVVHKAKIALVITSALAAPVNVIRNAKMILISTSALAIHVKLIRQAKMNMLCISALAANTHLVHKSKMNTLCISVLAATVNVVHEAEMNMVGTSLLMGGAAGVAKFVSTSEFTTNANVVHEAEMNMLLVSVLTANANVFHEAEMNALCGSVLTANANVFHEAEMSMLCVSVLTTNINLINEAEMNMLCTSLLAANVNLIHKAEMNILCVSVLAANAITSKLRFTQRWFPGLSRRTAIRH